jgi:hypothetical protein
VYSIASKDPASTLYEALQHFERRSPKADDMIRAVVR